MTTEPRSVRIPVMIVLMCAALLVYLVLLGRTAVLMIGSGNAVAIALGAALLVLPVIGLWAMVATLRAGFAHQKLARLAAADGVELDVSALPRRPSGRIERDAADALFDTVRAELADTPDALRTGLMNRTAMPADAGMLFALGPPDIYCFWMKDTLIPLSIAFIDRQGRIVDIQDMQPRSLEPHCPPEPITTTLEMNRGWFDKAGVKTGVVVRGIPAP